MDTKNDRLLITNNIPYGATLKVKDGQKVRKAKRSAHGIRSTT
jgi:DNA-directed RNA polymerase subunit beta'